MGILLAAAIATVSSLLIIGGLIAWRSQSDERRILALLVLIQLPLSPLVFYGIRVPLDWLLEQWVVDGHLRRLLSVLHRPVIEELAKLTPLLIPSIWRSTTSDKKILRGLAIGLGFGIGEMWMLADIVFRNEPEKANLPLMTLVGFINERIMVCAIHGTLTAVALQTLLGSVVVAILLHGLGNLPFYLQEISALGLQPERWTMIIRAWVLWYFFSMMTVLWSMSGGDLHIVWLLFGDATCPFCGMVYPRATMTWSLRVIHHDHCPRCKARNIMHG